MMLVTLKEHCRSLVEILKDPMLISEWESTVEWLRLAASIKCIEVDMIEHELFGFCKGGDKYDIAHEDLMNRFVMDLSIFNFVWAALESCLNQISPPKHPDKSKRGKINNACHYLSQYFAMKPLLPLLHDEINAFRLASSLCLGYKSVEKRFHQSEGAGFGLFTVYELRNLFAHGSSNFPRLDENNEPIINHHCMMCHATRIVLIYIQMLLLAYFDYSSLKVVYSWHKEVYLEEEILWIALSYCHLTTQSTEIQISLF
jgi:hypothetical protein